MRMVSCKDLMELPSGTIYREVTNTHCVPPELGEWCRKCQTIRDPDGKAFDWVYADLSDLGRAPGDSGGLELHYRWGRVVTGEEMPIRVTISRDGLFDHDRQYMIYDSEDIRRFADMLTDFKIDIDT